MTASPAECRPEPMGSPDSTVRAALDTIESSLADTGGPAPDSGYFEQLSAQLQRLHVRVRAQHSAARMMQPDDPLPPEFADELERLQGEHSMILGQIDRVVRMADSITDRSLEDREVFFLRIREMIATLRRHEAEEDRLLCLAVWRDIGGES